MKLENFVIDDLIDKKYMHKKINKDVFLSDYQISVLQRNDINPYKYSSIKNLMYEINEVLEENNDEELDNILYEIEEFYYYNCVNK